MHGGHVHTPLSLFTRQPLSTSVLGKRSAALCSDVPERTSNTCFTFGNGLVTTLHPGLIDSNSLLKLEMDLMMSLRRTFWFVSVSLRSWGTCPAFKFLMLCAANWKCHLVEASSLSHSGWWKRWERIKTSAVVKCEAEPMRWKRLNLRRFRPSFSTGHAGLSY